MNKIITFSVICIFIFFSCHPPKELTNSAFFTLINKTSKKSVAIVQTQEVGTKELKVYNKGDSISFSWIKISTYRDGCITPINVTLYDLTDTCSIDWIVGKLFDIYNTSLPISQEDSIVKKSWVINCYSASDGALHAQYHLYVNDTLLPLLIKDYSMLEKFKDYYSK